MKMILKPFTLLILLYLLANVQLIAQTITGSSSVCEGESANYTITSNAISYVWNASGASTIQSTHNSADVVWGNGTSGQVSVIGLDASGGVAFTASLGITINPLPKIVLTTDFTSNCLQLDPTDSSVFILNTSSCLQACKGNAVLYSVLNTNGSTYDWTILGATQVDSINRFQRRITWSNSSNGSIKIIEQNTFGCLDSITQCLDLIESPTAQIGALNEPLGVDTINTCVFTDLYLKNYSIGGNTYNWDYGNGKISTDLDPIVNYSAAGVYTVILEVKNNCYCFGYDTLIINVTADPPLNIECPSVVCAGDTVEYFFPTICPTSQILLSNINGGLFLGWDTTGRVGQFVWTGSNASFSATMLNCDTLCDFSTTIEVPVITPNNEIIGESSVCALSQVEFSVRPLGGSSYNWNVPSQLGTIIDGFGTYKITIQTNSPLPSTSISDSISVTYNHPLLLCSGTSKKFVSIRQELDLNLDPSVCQTDVSVYQLPLKARWKVLDESGNLLQSKNTSSFTVDWSNYTAGSYSVTAKDKFDKYCGDQLTAVASIEVIAKPEAPIQINGDTIVCRGNAYSYKVLADAQLRVEWEITGGTPTFQNGNEIGVRWNPTGNYKLKAKYVRKFEPYCVSDSVVLDVLPVVNSQPIIVVADTVCSTHNTTFALNFKADYVEWSIAPASAGSIISDRFGDSIVVLNSFNTTNQNYTVTALAEACGQSYTLQKTVIKIGIDNPDINVSPPDACIGEQVTFSTGLAQRYSWNIDGHHYGSQSVTTSFTSGGSKNISLGISSLNTGAANCESNIGSSMIYKVKEGAKAALSVDDPNTAHCFSLHPMKFYATLVSSSGVSYQWFRNGSGVGSGLTYSDTSYASYYYIVTDSTGCSTKSNTILISRNCGGSQCANGFSEDSVDVMFSDGASCNERILSSVTSWVGSVTSITSVSFPFPQGTAGNAGVWGKSFTYHEAGIYSLVIRGNVTVNGVPKCFVKLVTDTIESSPDFEVFFEQCEGDSILYRLQNRTTFISTAPSYSWNFGAGIPTSSAVGPTVLLPSGNRTITLSTPPSVCAVSKTINVPVPAKANFILPSSACQQEPLTFIDSSLGGIIDHRWDLGGKFLVTKNATGTFENMLNYTAQLTSNIKLVVIDTLGCVDSVEKQLDIFGNTIDFQGNSLTSSQSDFCFGDSTELKFSPSDPISSNGNILYLWSNLQSTPTVWAKEAGDYQVFVIDSVGCRKLTPFINVGVKTPPKPIISGKSDVCFGDTTLLNAESGKGVTYIWFDGSTNLSLTEAEIRLALDTGSHSITVIANDSVTGCSSLSEPFILTVLPSAIKPSISVGNQSAPYCEEDKVTLTANGSYLNFQWSNGQNTASTEVHHDGLYRVTITDANQCTSSNEVMLNAKPDFNNFFSGCYCFPAGGLINFPNVANYASYQWLDNGQPIAAPNGTSQYFQFNEGNYSLIASTDSGCIDTSDVASINRTNCTPCFLDFEIPTLSCKSLNADGSVSFEITVPVTNSGSASFMDYTATINGSSFLGSIGFNNINVTPGSSTKIGTLTIDNPDSSMVLCIVFGDSASTQAHCQQTFCMNIPPPSCNTVPTATYDFDEFSCQVRLQNITAIDPCEQYEHDITWEIDGVTYRGEEYYLDLKAGSYSVNQTITTYGYDGSDCITTNTFTINVPDCPCNDLEDDMTVDVVFTGFEPNCKAMFEFVYNLNIGNGVFLGATSSCGKVVGFDPNQVNQGGGQSFFTFQLNPDLDQDIECCVKFYFEINGEIYCKTVCFTIPVCPDQIFRKKSIINLNSDKFSISPNPTKGHLTLKWKQKFSNSKGYLKIYTPTGRLALDKEYSDLNGSLQLDLSNFERGIYVIEWMLNNTIFREKLIVNP